MNNDNNIKKSKKNNNIKVDTLCIKNKYMERKDKITSFFLSKEYRPMTMKEIAGLLNIQNSEVYMLKNILNELCDSRKINF
jgi:hypothetical protein